MIANSLARRSLRSWTQRGLPRRPLTATRVCCCVHRHLPTGRHRHLPADQPQPVTTLRQVVVSHNAVLTHFVIAQDVALTLATLKIAEPLPTVGTTSYNLGLLDADDVNPGSLAPSVILAGLPAYVSHDVPWGTALRDRRNEQFTYQRNGTNLAVSSDSAFDYDAIRIRVTARHEQAFCPFRNGTHSCKKNRQHPSQRPRPP